MYVPRTVAEVESDLRALVAARTPITDFTEGGIAAALIRAISFQVAATERSIYRVREGFFLGLATGDDLDERVAELPPVGITRIIQSPASGAVLRLTRANTVGTLEVPAGSIFATQAGTQYRTLYASQFSNGAATLSDVYIVATTPGSATNCAADSITQIVSAPADVLEVTNTAPLTNGADLETDAELQARALAYLQSLSRSQPAALDFLARSFVASSGERMRFVNVFEDVEHPGYTEVIVDDGTGMEEASVSVVGPTIQGIISTGGYNLLYHAAPATAPISPQNIAIKRGFQTIVLSANDIVSIPERGILYLKESAPVQAGDTWEISGYRVYTGYIAELQSEIEGDTSNAAVLSGFRAAGTRVVVCAPTRQIVRFDIALQVAVGQNYNDVERTLRIALAGYISSIPPGSPLYVSTLYAVARGVFGVQDISFFRRGTSEPLTNAYPDSPRSALRTDSSSIVVVQTPAS